MSALGNFLVKALSTLKTDRDVPIGVSDGGDERGALHVFNVNSSGGSSSNPYAPPSNTNKIIQTFNGNIQTVEYYNTATLLKTVTITYSDCDSFVAVVS
jgi:hypothetical protein